MVDSELDSGDEGLKFEYFYGGLDLKWSAEISATVRSLVLDFGAFIRGCIGKYCLPVDLLKQPTPCCKNTGSLQVIHQVS